MGVAFDHLMANCAILLFIILGWTNQPQKRAHNGACARLKLGFFFGIGALLVMLRPIEAGHGLQVDLRSIPIALAGLVGGWPGAMIAAAMAGAFRLWLGGAGAILGVVAAVLMATIGAGTSAWLAGRTPSYRELGMFAAFLVLVQASLLVIAYRFYGLDVPFEASAMWLAMIFVTTLLASLAMFAELRRRSAASQLKIYEAVIQSLPESLNVKDAEGRFLLANPATAKLMHASSVADLIGKTDHDFYPADVADTFRADEASVLEDAGERILEQVVRFPDMEPIFLSTLKAPLRDDDGKLLGLITHNRNLTEQKRLSLALAASERRAHAALANMADGLIMFDADLNVIFCNQQYRDMFPLTADVRVPGMPARKILQTAIERGELKGIPPDQASTFIDGAMSRLRQSGTVEFPLFDGRWVESRTSPSEDGGCLVVCSDITRSKRDEQELRSLNEKLAEMAMTDSLTELLNRRAFDTSLASEISRCQGTDVSLSLLLIDVDRFKAYNDTYGHTAGDNCLKKVAQVVRLSTRRPGDRAARYGGEEMAIILPNTSEDGAVTIAHELRKRIRELAIPHVGSEKGIVTVSIGVATITSSKRQPEPAQFISRADEALYRAKSAGRDAVRSGDDAADAGKDASGRDKVV